LRVDDVQPGLYFYRPLDHRLDRLLQGDLSDSLEKATYLGESIRGAGACIVITATFLRSRFKYGERAYRFVLLEAGHIAQNILLVAEAQDLGAVAVGGFVDDQVNDLLGLDGLREAALYLVLVGRV
jgi:SagB-type dehydrogenase family enzyme